MSLSNRVDVKHLLNSAYISGDYDKEHIKALTKLITPSNMLYVILISILLRIRTSTSLFLCTIIFIIL